MGCDYARLAKPLGFTYRDVGKASYEIAVRRGRPKFILHISRLADIEIATLCRRCTSLYSLSTILRLDPVEISTWYEAPFHQTFQDSANFPPPRTHLREPFLPTVARASLQDVPHPPERTDLLDCRPESAAPMLSANRFENGRYRYGYVGLSDRRMVPLPRPGSTVVIDTACRNNEDEEWSNEYARPM